MARPLGERCLTHQAELILCESCVIENAMRIRRRLDRAIQKVLDGPECAGLNNHQREGVLKKLLAELEKELPE